MHVVSLHAANLDVKGHSTIMMLSPPAGEGLGSLSLTFRQRWIATERGTVDGSTLTGERESTVLATFGGEQ